MRIRAVLALAAIGAVVGGAVALGSVQERAPLSAGPPETRSGAWYCPHGGGSGWRVDVVVANPETHPVSIRVTTFSEEGTGTPHDYEVPPQSDLRVSVKAGTRGAASEVEYFEGWVGASWAARAGGGESGLDAEPCASTLARTWLMPDGTTLRGNDAWIVVMNPTAAPAIFGVRLATEGETIVTKDWADFVLPPRRSTAFFLNRNALGRESVAAEVHVDAGRVAAASLGTSRSGGIRAALGITGAERDAFLPGGQDVGRTTLVIDDAGTRQATYRGAVETPTGPQIVGQLRNETLQAGQAKSYDLTTEPDAAIDVTLSTGDGFAVVRRSFGRGADMASTAGAAPARAWVVAGAVFGHNDGWRLVIANPGRADAMVELVPLPAPGTTHAAGTRKVLVSAGTTHVVVARFTRKDPRGAVLVASTGEPVVPLATSFARADMGFAMAVGEPIPGRLIGQILP
jgi:hypothetical protein